MSLHWRNSIPLIRSSQNWLFPNWIESIAIFDWFQLNAIFRFFCWLNILVIACSILTQIIESITKNWTKNAQNISSYTEIVSGAVWTNGFKEGIFLLPNEVTNKSKFADSSLAIWLMVIWEQNTAWCFLKKREEMKSWSRFVSFFLVSRLTLWYHIHLISKIACYVVISNDCDETKREQQQPSQTQWLKYQNTNKS